MDKVLKWQFIKDSKYKVTKDNKLFNCQTEKQLKLTINGSSKPGFWIGKKFHVVNENFRKSFEKIIPNECPFGKN